MPARLRVLLVEDDEKFVEAVKAVLVPDERFDVVGVANDGRRAVELTEELEPDLVLVDIGLPGIDGVEATRAIRKRCPSARVVMLTGRTDRADIERTERAGAIGYVMKDELGTPNLTDSLLALVDLV
jgi:DNA-binding NarL/FixJ family response regulator